MIPVVITQPDRPRGRGHQMLASPVKEHALSSGIPVLQPKSIRKERESFEEHLLQYGPFDGAVVVAFGQILPKWLLDRFEGQCVNVHASLLPRWRGAAPIQRAIMAGDTETGVMLMKMEEGLDTGPVFATRKTSIAPDDTFESLHDRLAEIGSALLSETLASIIAHQLPAIPQSDSGVSYASRIEKSEAIIDWKKDARQLANEIRGLWPYPGSFFHLEGKRIKIRIAEAILQETPIAPPGTVLSTSAENIVIQCGVGALSLRDIQPEGKRLMKIRDFLRSRTIPAGTVLS